MYESTEEKSLSNVWFKASLETQKVKTVLDYLLLELRAPKKLIDKVQADYDAKVAAEKAAWDAFDIARDERRRQQKAMQALAVYAQTAPGSRTPQGWGVAPA